MPMVNMMLGEVAPGGIGSGLYGMLVLAVITVFVAGLMVGRTPEYLGKKIGAREIKFASLYFLTTPALVLVGTAAAMATGNQRDRAQRRPARLVRGAVRVHLGGQQQRLGVRRHHRQHRRGGTPRSGWRCCSAGSCRSSSCSAWPARWPGRQPVPESAGTLPTYQPLFVGMLVGVTVDPGRADLPARPRARPARRGPVMTTREGSHMTVTRGHRAGGRAAGRRAARAGSAAACWTPSSCWRSLPDALRKLDPRTLWRNPVMFIVEIGAVFTTVLAIADPTRVRLADHGLAVADRACSPTWPRRSPRAAARRRPRRLRRAKTGHHGPPADRLAAGRRPAVPRRRCRPPTLQPGDIVVVEAGEIIPGDGDVVEGIASVDESAITGESAPVIRESGGDRSAVTGGTKVLSDRIVVRITQKPGESFIDRMIALVEGANRQKTPNEIALNILLAALTIIFLLAVATLQPLAIFSKA